MEVDKKGVEGGRSSGSKLFKNLRGNPSFNQRVAGRDHPMEANKDSVQNGFSVAMDASPAGPTLPFSTVGSPRIFGPNQINHPPPPPQHARPVQRSDQADAMAIKVEKFHQQKEKEKEQYKAVLVQKESERAETKDNVQKAFYQRQGEHREHFKNMESEINEVHVVSNQEMHNQKGQRDFELKAQEIQAKNAALEHELLQKQ